jgi:hypothetical protein
MRFLYLLLLPFLSTAQALKPGFEADEYRNLMRIFAQTSLDSSGKYLPGADWQRTYRSAELGLDNLWELWTHSSGTPVISVRGTTMKAESWLANFYAAMVPAKGTLELEPDYTFSYDLVENELAAVHVGWLIGMAYLARDLQPKLDSLVNSGQRDLLIMGHSQGGAIAYLLNSYLRRMQANGKLPQDLRIKTYCSAAPKPGNLFFAYEYEANTAGGWSFNVVNAADWVPETPISIQTLNDFTPVNPFVHASSLIKKMKFPQKMVLKRVYKQLDKPTRKAQRNYEKYLGRMTSKLIGKALPMYKAPGYYQSNYYVRTGTLVVLYPRSDYFERFPADVDKPFGHHMVEQYLYLLDKL